VESVCCLLHNAIAGGSARQWIHLLGRHVADGGRATILAPAGPLFRVAREAGIEAVDISWDEGPASGALTDALAGHEVAIVHWDEGVMWAFETALSVCGRAALALHQTPRMMERWVGPEVVDRARAPVERAIADPHGIALVRGDSHRARVAAEFDLPAAALRVLPASIPLPGPPAVPAASEPGEILALTRLSPEKASIVRLGAELTLAGLRNGRGCRLAVSGAGTWRAEAVSLCEATLPPGAWRIEEPPADPYVRLAAADLVVAQGLTTLEAAALERRVIVARTVLEDRGAGTVLTPGRYGYAARDPFGRPPLKHDTGRLWAEALAVSDADLRALRGLVERHNSLKAASRALGAGLAQTL
jgi:hypothetical protein